MNNNGMSVLLLVALAIYVLSPTDLVPGPIDDIILMLAYAITQRKAIVGRE